MELRYYQTASGERPLVDWFEGLSDRQARAIGQVIVLLLCAGDKRTQRKDIKRAKEYFEDFKARAAKKKRGA